MLDAKIKTLLMVAKMGSFTKAANRLHLTQPAVSHHIKALEEEYGVAIFSRESRPLELTREGELLHQYAHRIHEMGKKLEQSLVDTKQQKHSIQFGITQSAGESSVPKMLAQYGKENPDVVVRISTDSIKNLYTRLDDYTLDVIIAEGPVLSDSYRSVLLDTDFLSLVVSPNHPFAQRKVIQLASLKRESLIMRSSGSSTRTMFESYLLSEGESLGGFHVSMEIDNVAAIKELVSLNYGVTIIAQSACQAEIKGGRLVPVTIENARMSRAINMVYQSGFENTAILEDLQTIYREV